MAYFKDVPMGKATAYYTPPTERKLIFTAKDRRLQDDRRSNRPLDKMPSLGTVREYLEYTMRLYPNSWRDEIGYYVAERKRMYEMIRNRNNATLKYQKLGIASAQMSTSGYVDKDMANRAYHEYKLAKLVEQFVNKYYGVV